MGIIQLLYVVFKDSIGLNILEHEEAARRPMHVKHIVGRLLAQDTSCAEKTD